tara:strand:+ start:201 stop:2318 length:2118 start_codon:yes stop_codon:yes gene_type:complete
MAYGVKYRLEFSDVLGYGKKVEILKKDYTGEILPMIGGAEPVTIKWNSSDDFYKPLIGSQCTLDLIVTDDVQYDDFYKFDEREFKVKISYSKSISESYADRVTNDNGIYESLECIDNVLGYFNAGSINYADYWVGFLVVDRFTERITSTPYNIKFNAFDGIGTLDNFYAPISTYNTSSNYLGLTDLERISKILEDLDLDLDIVFINDLNYLIPDSGGNTAQFPNSVTFEKQDRELFNGLDLYSSKNQLELLLSLYNMRIYQSFGKWFIVEISNNFDTTVKSDIVNLNINNQAPQNIRELITKRLNSINGEFISSKRYNYLGAFQATENISTVISVPKQLKPFKNDLNREYLQPLQSITKKLSTTQFDRSFYNANPGFEYDLNGWVVTSSRALIATNTIDIQGKKSIYLNASTSGDLECISSAFPDDWIWNIILKDIKYQFSFYVESSEVDLGMNIRFQIYLTGYLDMPDLYFNVDTGNWQSASVINEIENFKNNTFVNVSQTLKDPFEDGFNSISQRSYIQIKIFNTTPGQSGTGYVNTYFDNVGFSHKYATSTSVLRTRFDTEQPKTTDIIASRITNTLYSSNKQINSILAPGIGFYQNWYRSRDKFLNQGANNYQTISNISNQSIMNDFREFCTRYDGSFRVNNPTPLALINKLWFNWVDVLQDPEPSIIDGISYKVKSGEFNVNSHVPNNDNDLNINVKITV